MIIFENVGILYIALAFSITIHELSHLLTAKLISLKVYRFVLGDEFLSIETKKIRISPLILYGYVEFDENSLKGKKEKDICLFFLSGIMSNLFLLLMSIIFLRDNFYGYSLISINIFIIFYSLIPFKFLKNDLYQIKKFIKNIKS